MKRVLNVLPIGFLAALLISACGIKIEDATQRAVLPEPSTVTTSVPPDILSSPALHMYTTQNNMLGNHVIEGSTDLQSASTIDIPLDGEPLWLVCAPFQDGVVFAAVLEDGQTQAFKIIGKSYEPFEMSPAQIPVGMPPLLITSEDNAHLIPPPPDASLLTNPILVKDKLVYIASNGDLVLSGSGSQTRLAIDAVPDARILTDENDRLLILIQPTNRYPHGVLGDDLEASGIVLVETTPALGVVQHIPIQVPDVVEGISPIWADINHGGTREIIVTLSNDQSGSRIVAFREDGTLLAEGLPIGLGHRWRHQVAVAAFGPETLPLVVDIRTPHIGGVVEFYQLNNGNLEIVKEIAGFSAHSIGSRNLDSAIVGDFDGNGIHELLAPDQSQTSLGIISLDGRVTTVPLDGVLTSNLSVTAVDGRLILGAGTRGKLRIWIP